jgi:hypothetical protein
MEAIPVCGVYQVDCLVLLERLESERVTLAYVDAPWNTMGGHNLPSPAEYKSSEKYLEFMSRVLQQIQRVLSASGSLYFHSEPRLTGDIRLVLDEVFGRDNFRAEFVWPRGRVYSASGLRAGHDTIFLYSRSASFVYNHPLRALSDEEVRSRYHHSDESGPYSMVDLTVSIARPDQQFQWKGFVPPPGRSWRYSQEELDRLDQEGKIYRPRNGLPKKKEYLEEHPGVEVGSIWDDISRISPRSAENLGYPGQRPPALLERIVHMGSNEGDIVLDPFCGTGPALVAAQANRRKWIGCDLSAEACSITATRLEKTFGLQRETDFLLRERTYVEQFPIIQSSYASVAAGVDQRKEETMYFRDYLSSFYLLKLIRDGELTNSHALERALRRPGSSRSLRQMRLALSRFQELGLITIDENGTIEPTSKIEALLEAFDLGLTKMSDYGPDSLLVNPIFRHPRSTPNHADIFVLMPFRETLRPVYEDHIKTVAGRFERPVARADDFFSSESIIEEIWDAINAAEIVIADCTGRNPNVFYEIGMAHTLGKRVILISQALDDVPFDLRQRRVIEYEFTPRGMEVFEQNLFRTLQTELQRARSTEVVLQALRESQERAPYPAPAAGGQNDAFAGASQVAEKVREEAYDEDLRQRCREIADDLRQFLEDHASEDKDELVRQYHRYLGDRASALLEELEKRGMYPPETLKSFELAANAHPRSPLAISRLAKTLGIIGHKK